MLGWSRDKSLYSLTQLMFDSKECGLNLGQSLMHVRFKNKCLLLGCHIHKSDIYLWLANSVFICVCD